MPLPPWIVGREPRGPLVLQGQNLIVTLGEAEAALERVAIMVIDGHCSERTAEAQAYRELLARRGVPEG